MVKSNSSLSSKLDLILEKQDEILKNEEKILGEEFKLEDMEHLELENENLNQKTEEEALLELEKLEKELKHSISNPLKRVTRRDFFKGFIGAFFGIMGHFAFYKGADIAKELSFLRATILYVVAFVIIVIMLYYTGFRKVKKQIVLSFLPIRALILYSVSIITVILVNWMFDKIHYFTFMEIYKLVGASIILAVIGAGTADLIGGGE